MVCVATSKYLRIFIASLALHESLRNQFALELNSTGAILSRSDWGERQGH